MRSRHFQLCKMIFFPPQNYTASIDDLNKVLELDTHVTEAQKELLEVSEILEKIGRSGSLTKTCNQEKQRKHIQIQEVYVSFDIT